MILKLKSITNKELQGHTDATMISETLSISNENTEYMLECMLYFSSFKWSFPKRNSDHVTKTSPLFSSLHIFPYPPASLALLNKLFCYQNIRILWAWFRKSQVALKRDQILFQIPPRDLRHQSQLLAPRHERLRPIPSRLSTINFIEFPL